MTFDIHRPLSGEQGEIDDDAALKLEAELLDRFAEAPEARPIVERYGRIRWASTMMEYGRIYNDVTVTTISRAALSAILLDTFPRRVSCDPADAPAIVEELRAFWSFLRRDTGLANAQACLALLDDAMVRAMKRELANVAKFGPAKLSLLAMREAGFVRSTAKGKAPSDGPLPSEPHPLRPLTKAERNKKKAERREQRAAGHKNR